MIRELLELQITETFGLVPGLAWSHLLDEALADMAKRHALCEHELIERIRNDRTLMRELAGYLTVDESYFLRHADQYPVLLDTLAAQVRRHGEALVWSLGCARGEEPYSLAILARERLGVDAAKVRILATDINPRALSVARRACYGDWSFRGVPARFIEQYFERQEDGLHKLAEELCRAVEFEWAALPERLYTVPSRSVDFIVFRNVAIYFEARMLRQVYERFALMLKPGGLILTAPADPAPPRELFVRVENSWTGVFHLRSEEAPARVVATPPPPTVARPRVVTPKKPPRTSRGSDSSPPVLRFDSEIASATRRIEGAPSSRDGYVQRGRLHLSLLRAEEAARDFRSALYLDPTDKVTRFWYAAALHRAGRLVQARAQVSRLTEELETLQADIILGDGATRANKLLEAVLLMRASLT